jgi:hypothetical protein
MTCVALDIRLLSAPHDVFDWIPAFAGMTSGSFQRLKTPEFVRADGITTLALRLHPDARQ